MTAREAGPQQSITQQTRPGHSCSQPQVCVACTGNGLQTLKRPKGGTTPRLEHRRRIQLVCQRGHSFTASAVKEKTAALSYNRRRKSVLQPTSFSSCPSNARSTEADAPAAPPLPPPPPLSSAVRSTRLPTASTRLCSLSSRPWMATVRSAEWMSPPEWSGTPLREVAESVSDTRAVFLSFACVRYQREVRPPSLPRAGALASARRGVTGASASRTASAVTLVIASSRFAARPVMTGSIVMMLAHVQACGAELPCSAGSAGVAGRRQVSHSRARCAGGPNCVLMSYGAIRSAARAGDGLLAKFAIRDSPGSSLRPPCWQVGVVPARTCPPPAVSPPRLGAACWAVLEPELSTGLR